MGGDCFEGVQKLTNDQYEKLVPEILTQLSGLYIRAESYVPMPQKLIHGDIDFLMILKPEIKLKDIIDRLKIERFHINNNQTINSVYKNKQVDFCIKQNNEQFEIAKFYKSYSGMGAHLGLFLPSKQVKLSDSGLFVLAYKQHIKYQFLITRSIQLILKFYGLDFETYQKGFKTRKQLFNYLRGCSFMNQKSIVDYDSKNRSKLTKFFIEYLKNQVNDLRDKKLVQVDVPIEYTLKYFKKQEQFKYGFKKTLDQIERKQKINKKFNGLHIMQHFKIETKKVNKIKQKFRKLFKDETQYLTYIDQHEVQQILKRMENELGLQVPKIQKQTKPQIQQTDKSQKDETQNIKTE